MNTFYTSTFCCALKNTCRINLLFVFYARQIPHLSKPYIFNSINGAKLVFLPVILTLTRIFNSYQYKKHWRLKIGTGQRLAPARGYYTEALILLYSLDITAAATPILPLMVMH